MTPLSLMLSSRMATHSDLVPSERFLQEVTANRVHATGLESSGWYFRRRRTADCVRDGVSVLKLRLTHNCDFKKKPCG